MRGFVDIGAADRFPLRRPVIVSPAGRQIVVVQYEAETFYAIRNVCPHQLASFADGWVMPDIRAASYDEIWLDTDVPVIRCPRHFFTYRLTDGVCRSDPRWRIRTFPVVCEGGRVLIDLSTRRAVGGGSEAAPTAVIT
jgi:3-phenylpropionate/trans-cinnamate dioxygenase ferredoxin subunit